MFNSSALFYLRCVLLTLGLTIAVACSSSSPTTLPTSPPTSRAAQSTSAPTVPASAPSASAKIIFAVPKTTEYRFTAQDPDSKITDTLTALGVPRDAQRASVGAGGLPPATTLPALSKINDLAGAVYDAASGRLLFVGTFNPTLPEIDPADFIVALRAAYSNKEPPAVSIDPINPNDFGGPMQVSYFGNTENTHFGQVMFEADRYLKTLSGGQDNVTKQPVVSKVPGYKSELDWMLQFSSSGRQQQWHRMWYFIPNKEIAIRVSADNRAMMFDQVPIRIESRFVVFDSQGKKHDVPGSDPAVDAFVSHFNSHFAEFAAEKKEVGQIVQLTKLLSIARWVAKQTPADLDWLSTYPVTVKTPERTPGQIVTKSKTETQGPVTYTYTVTLFGGVDMDFEVKPRVPASGDPVHQFTEASRALPLDQRDAELVQIGNQTYQAALVYIKKPQMTGNLVLASKAMSLSASGRLPLEFTLHYDSFNTDRSPVGVGWSIESARLAFPPTKNIYQIDGRRVELYDSVTVINPATNQRRQYRNSKKIINGRVVYEIEAGQGATLYYSYLEGVYSLQDGQIENRFDDNGLLKTLLLGNERIEIRRDAARNPTAFEHSNGSAIRLTYDQGRPSQITGSNGAQARLTYDGSNLAKIERSDGTTTFAYSQGRPSQIKDGTNVVQFEFDALGRVTRRQDAAWLGSTRYETDGASITTISGPNDRRLIIERDASGRTTRAVSLEIARMADHVAARRAFDPANLEQGSFLKTALDQPNTDLAWLTANRFEQVIVEPSGYAKRTVRVEERNMAVDGELNVERVRAQWPVCQRSMDQLSQQGFTRLTADPQSGVVVGFNTKTNETVALIPRPSGEPTRRVFTQLSGEAHELMRLATVLGGQARGLAATGFFTSPKEEWLVLNSNGEIKPFLTGAESTLKELEGVAWRPGNREQKRQLAEQPRELLRRDVPLMFQSEWKIGSAKNAEELVYEAYPSARQLFRAGIPSEVVKQVQGSVRPGETIRLQPLETQYGWLLPDLASGNTTFFIDAPTSLGYFIAYHFGANKIRLIDASSTPASAQEYLAREQLIPSRNVVVLFSPHSESTPEQVKAQRELFQAVRERFEKLQARVVDLGGDPAARDKLLTELKNAEGRMIVLQIGHSGEGGQLHIQGDAKIRVGPNDFQVVRGVEHFMTCCSLQNGLSEAAVRAGANSATGNVEPITLGEAIKQLQKIADYLTQHPQGIRPSEMEQELRIRILLETGRPGLEPLFLDISLNTQERGTGETARNENPGVNAAPFGEPPTGRSA